jgi:hypothetical protein
MKRKIEEILDILIEEIKEGKSVESCLKDYPEYADELRPLLFFVADIEEIPEPEVDPAAFSRIMARVNSIPEQKGIKGYLYGFRNLLLRPVVLKTVSLILIFTFILSMTFSFSADSLPGDFLYPVKCFCEKTQLAMTFNVKDKSRLHLELADRKMRDFKLVFEKEEKINRELLNSMIDEASNALQYCDFLSSEECSTLVAKAKDCHKKQIKVLQTIKPQVHDTDHTLIVEAIDKCSLACQCANPCLSPEE